MTVRQVRVHEPFSHPEHAGMCHVHDHVAEIDERPFAYLVYLLAGAAADWKVSGRNNSGDAEDRKQAMIVASISLEVERECPRVIERVQTAELVARALVQDDTNWKWIERVARVLMKKRTLSGREIFNLKPKEHK
jgi:hypothetical protein